MMFEIIKEIFKLIYQFINSLYYIEFDILPEKNIYLGNLVLITVFILLALYLILYAIGIVREG